MDLREKQNVQKVRTSIQYLDRILKLLNKAGKTLILPTLLFGLLSSITPSISVLIMQEMVNTLQVSHNDLEYLFKLLILYIAIDVVQSLMSLLSGYCEQRLQMNGTIVVNMTILEKVKDFSLKDFENSETYDTLQRAMNVGFIRIFGFFKSFILLFQSLINIILFSLILMAWKWWLVPVILRMPIINTKINTYFGERQFLVVKERAGAERKAWYSQYLLTKDTAFKEIKLFELGAHLRDRYKSLQNTFIAQDIKLLNQKSLVSVLLIVLEEVTNSFLLVFIILKAFQGEILLGSLTTYIRSISSVKSNAQSFLAQINAIYENVLYIGQYFEFIDRDVEEETAAIKSGDNPDRTYVIPPIEIRNLSYRYRSQSEYALHHINLKIENDSLVAFIGMNGSGKTTLVKILSTLYKDYEGEIFFGGRELSELCVEKVRKKIGILFQDFIRYELTARENVAFGSLAKLNNSSDIESVIRDVGMDKRIQNLDMQLGVWFDEGMQLSGGEWLKIALGRAFIRDAELYLLDEPNAALDPISERIILKSFKKLSKGKIGIIVSHRIASIKDIVDRIIVFNHGAIEAKGNHNELLKISPTYREMFYAEITEEESNL